MVAWLLGTTLSKVWKKVLSRLVRSAWRPNRDKAEEAARLCAAHKLTGPFACAFLLKDGEAAGPHKAALFPCLSGDKLIFRNFGLVLLGSDIQLPTGLVNTVADAPARRDLVPLRVFIPKALVTEER